MNKRHALARLLDATGLLGLPDRLAKRPRLIAFNYHRIGSLPDNPYDPGLWSADADNFRFQVDFLKRHFDVISPTQLPDIARAPRGRYALITFDDGYIDNYRCAFPILRDAAVPATFFVATGYIDAPSVPWWDEIAWMTATSPQRELRLPDVAADTLSLDPAHRQRSLDRLLTHYKALPGAATAAFLDTLATASGVGRHPPVDAGAFWMNWSQLREMQQAGMCIAGHTVHHPVLSSLPRAEQAAEIHGCQARLHAELGQAPHVFSYPVGGRRAFNADTRACLTEAGIDFAFSYYGGHVDFSHWDHHDTPRVAIEPYIDRHWFRAIARLPEVFA
ncbi:MAG TPA: polysaccharide deacetylase family protein [Rhodanobacteraceae bacterium]|nr:polysaccharide deacetylase family protein [Rhodanobacteraceae bacterium]